MLGDAAAAMTDAGADDTARVTATRAADTDADAAMMVTAEDAAAIAGVSVRTIRRWIQQGHLAYEEGPAGKMVSPADLPAARRLAGRGRGHGHDRRGQGHGHGHNEADAATDAVTSAPGALAPMEMIRDQWLAPLVARIEELSRDNGRLEAERDALRVELERVRAEQDAPVAQPEAPGATEPPRPPSEPLMLRWRRWWRRVTGDG